MKDFAKRLKAVRESKKIRDSKWTQGYVSDAIGVARPTYTAYENGTKQPPLETVNRIADLFEVSSDYLLGRTDEKQVSLASEGRAYYGGGDDWTEEERQLAQAAIEDWRRRKKEMEKKLQQNNEK